MHIIREQLVICPQPTQQRYLIDDGIIKVKAANHLLKAETFGF